jgi:parvulin-like peptidyl-prolyl isomerase
MRMILFFVFLFICVSPIQAKVVDRIEAVIGNEVVTSLDVENLAPFYKQYPLQGIIDDYMIKRFCLEKGITVKEDEVDDYIRKVAEENNTTPDKLLKKIEGGGVKRGYYRKKIAFNIIKRKFMQKFIVPFIYITDEDVRNYYEEHKKDFAQAERIKIDMILFKKDEGKLAEDVIKNIHQNKVSFEKAKDMYSIRKDKPVFIPLYAFNEDVKDIIQKTRAGEVCGPVEVKEGIYILKVLDKVGGGFVPLDVVREDIKKRIFEDKVSYHLDMWLRASEKRMQVKIIR